ncbi:hypothetical protein [Paenibacillus lutrae]|uniref:Uncharacterized protein n=1 Tax=Paenibacillus lutrae TaxID=2078573 RepID=A0A7X3FIY5_9BACL|nr:hypothetical protein [Paenibacillus lutrae]MVP00349.1 hypothetical protein [Paenibacillus lutrae]
MANYSVSKHTAVTVGSSSTAINTGNSTRRYLLLVNDSDEVIYVNLGGTAALNTGLRINPNGGSYEMTAALGNVYQGVINAISSSGNKVLLVTEGV